MNRVISTLIVTLLLVSMLLPSTAQVPGTTEEMQAWLTNPWVLFGLMVFGSIISAVKQWSVAKMDGAAVGVGLGQYMAHLQELFVTLGGNTLAFFALVDSGNLNFISAVSLGYVINSVADLNPMGNRSSSLTQK